MRIGYAYSRYPVLSQTFCDMEMLELERRDWELVLASMYPPKTELRHEYLDRLRAEIHYAPEKHELESLMRKAKRHGRWPAELIADHERKYGPEYKPALRARNALFFVQLFERARVHHFHVHFANRAAHTALFVNAISGIRFSVTAHGQDFMSDLGNDELLREICAAAEFVAAETNYSRDSLAQRCPESAGKFVRVYNGTDLSRFPAPPRRGQSHERVRILSVGRLVAFKGFDVLIDACAHLHERGLNFVCEIIGEGPLRADLEQRAARRGVADCVQFAGEQPQAHVLDALRTCDVFALAAKIDDRGASDVFPTVIAEAMASAKPVVSTTVAGIPELVGHKETGVLTPANDAIAFATALGTLIGNEDLRQRFGRAGRERIEKHFAIERTIEPLIARLTATQKSEIRDQR